MKTLPRWTKINLPLLLPISWIWSLSPLCPSVICPFLRDLRAAAMFGGLNIFLHLNSQPEFWFLDYQQACVIFVELKDKLTHSWNFHMQHFESLDL